MGMEMSGNAMMGGGGGMTPAEAILVSDRNRNYDDGMFGGSGSWVFFLFFLLAWGNGGWGGFGNRNMVGEAVATNADLREASTPRPSWASWTASTTACVMASTLSTLAC